MSCPRSIFPLHIEMSVASSLLEDGLDLNFVDGCDHIDPVDVLKFVVDKQEYVKNQPKSWINLIFSPCWNPNLFAATQDSVQTISDTSGSVNGPSAYPLVISISESPALQVKSSTT